MREGLLKAQKPTRKLRQLLVLFALVLMPSLAWGQTTITVAGTEVSTSGAITSDNISGSVSIDFTTNTLTLTSATINGDITWNTGSDLTIEMKGKNSVIGDINTDTPTGACSLLIKRIDTEESATLKYTGNISNYFILDLEDGFKDLFSNTVETITYKYYTTLDVYDLEVGNMTVHNIEGEYGYKGDILQDGESPTVTFDGTSILTLNNATITDKRIFWGAMDTDLTINLIGTSTITNTTESCIAAEVNNLAFTRGDNDNPCSLELSCQGGNAVISGFNNSDAPTMGAGLHWFPTTDGNDQIISATVKTLFSGGDGTPTSPFLIKTYDDLKDLATYVNDGTVTNESIKLDADIDCTGKTDFAPIGNGTEPFQGNFDGNGKTISNLSMTDVDKDQVGLFGYNSGTIKNLTLSGCTISGGGDKGDNFVGAIAGKNTGAVNYCSVNGTSTISAYSDASTSVYAGAVVGDNTGGTISYNTYESTVTTKTKKQGETDYTTKSGQTQRGIGNGDDVIGQVELSGTKKVTITSTSTHGGFEVGADSYLFDESNNILYALPNSTVTINANPDNGYRPSLTLGDNTIEVTATEVSVDETYDHTEFSFTMSSADVTATLTFGIDISATGIAATIDNATYTGSAIEPTTVKATGVPGATGETALTKGTDFTIKGYKLSGETVASPINAGTYTVTIEGKGNYTGTKDVSYTITQATNAITTVPVGATGLTYTGEAQALIATEGVATFGDVVYCLTVDGTYSAAADIKGTNATTTDAPYTIYYKVVGTTNYAGIDPASIQVSIAKASITPVVNITGWTYGAYDATKNAPSVTEATNPGTGEVTYQYKVKDASDETYAAWPTTTAALNAMAAGTYTVKATVAATSNYQAGAATKDFTISAKSIAGATITLSAESFVFNGEVQKPTVTVKDGETPLALDTDYTLTNEGGTNVGEYTVTVTGKGNYDNTTTASTTFNITAKSLATGYTVNVDATQTYTYTGSEIKPAVTVTPTGGGTALTLNTDYTVTYSNNINAAASTAENAPTVTITGKGNYDENTTTTATFTIEQASLEEAIIDAIPNQSYTGSEVKPTVTVRLAAGGTALVLDQDYTVTYSNNINAAAADATLAPTVTITGKGNCKDSKSVTFTIDKANTTVTKVPTAKELTYTGEAQALIEAGTVSAGTLVYSKTLTGTFSGTIPTETNAGDYTVYYKIEGNDNYNGTDASETNKVSVSISQAEISAITLNQTELTYNGAEQSVSVTSVKAGTLAVASDYYTVSGNTATTAGTYTVTVTAKTDIANNFKGSATATFTIKDRTAEISFGSGLTYQTYYNAGEDFLIPDGVSAYIITGVEGTTVTVKKVSNLKAGIPFLLESTAGSTITKDPNETFEGNLLRYADDNVATSGKEYVLYKNEFVKATGNISAGKCYLDLGTVNPSRGMYGIGHDDSTAIEGIGPDGTENNNEWFDLQGRKIQKPTKAGLYIVNGKKVVINKK